MRKARYNKITEKEIQGKKSEMEKKIEELKIKEIENYKKALQEKKYKLQQGYTQFNSNIIARCRGGYI